MLSTQPVIGWYSRGDNPICAIKLVSVWKLMLVGFSDYNRRRISGGGMVSSISRITSVLFRPAIRTIWDSISGLYSVPNGYMIHTVWANWDKFGVKFWGLYPNWILMKSYGNWFTKKLTEFYILIRNYENLISDFGNIRKKDILQY